VVVVPTYNEAATISRLLDGLLFVTARWRADGRVDVLVVENNSPEGTGSIVRAHDEFGARFRARRADGLARAGVLETTSEGYGFQVENTRRVGELLHVRTGAVAIASRPTAVP
jgi:dolichol-phosphate mannosyltransferase